jgi:hypothetical protein
VTFPFDQAAMMMRANCRLAARLSQVAQAANQDWMKANARSVERLLSQAKPAAAMAAEAPQQQDEGIAQLARTISDSLEEVGGAFAEWQSNCVASLTGTTDGSPGDFARYTAWAWRDARSGGAEPEQATGAGV